MPWLLPFMPEPSRKPLHPLLLDPDYWHNRVEQLNLRERSLLVIPRPDLSSPAIDVAEIRIRTYDGIRLWGMTGSCTLGSYDLPARVRMICHDQPLEIDREAVCEGFFDIVIQEPAGRRLEDRVLDVMRACQTAADLERVDSGRISIDLKRRSSQPDEVRIASHLLTRGIQLG